MIHEDRELLAEPTQLNKQLVTFWGAMDDALPADEQHAVACQLVELAEVIRARAQREEPTLLRGVVDGCDTADNGASH